MVGSRLLGRTFNINDESAHKKDVSIVGWPSPDILRCRRDDFTLEIHIILIASTLVMVSFVDIVRVACSLKKLVIEMANEIIYPIRELTPVHC